METLTGFAARMPGSNAPDMALKQLYLFVRQQGTVMAFADVFLLLCLLFGGFACLVFLLGGRRKSARLRSTHTKKAGPMARHS
jgi:hypothetical protein